MNTIRGRLFLYGIFLSVCIASGLIYGGWGEIKWAIIGIVVLAVVVETVFKIQGKS